MSQLIVKSKKPLRHFFLPLLFLSFSLSLAQAQWTNLPSNLPYVFEWNKIEYSSATHLFWVRGRINGCGDPFTNAMFSVDKNGLIGGPYAWSGGGARVNSQCVAPIVLPNPTNGTPGDRHPFYGFACFDEQEGCQMFDGVEDAGKCDGTIPGVCAYQDNWHFSYSTKTWTQNAKPIYKGSVYNAALEYSVDAHKYYSVGGIISGNSSNLIHSYNPSTDTWQNIAYTGAVMPPRNGAGNIGNIPSFGVLIFGGRGGGSNDPALTDMYVLNVQTNVLTQLHPAHTYSATAVCSGFPKAAYDSLRNRVVMYCGDTGMWVFDIATLDWHSAGNNFGGPGLPAGGFPGMQTMTYDPDDDIFVLEQGNASQAFWKITAGQIQ